MNAEIPGLPYACFCLLQDSLIYRANAPPVVCCALIKSFIPTNGGAHAAIDAQVTHNRTLGDVCLFVSLYMQMGPLSKHNINVGTR